MKGLLPFLISYHRASPKRPLAIYCWEASPSEVSPAMSSEFFTVGGIWAWLSYILSRGQLDDVAIYRPEWEEAASASELM